HVDGSILIHQKARACYFYADRPGVRGVAKTGDANAAAQIALLVLAFCTAFFPFKDFPAFFKTLRQPCAVNTFARERISISFAGGVA
ncbi:hypothetical protein SB764_40745, partial [Paraburkholderia sp. SIMBA_027]